MPPIRLVVVDDHTLLRTALCDALQSDPRMEVAGEAGDGEQAIDVACATHPDIVLLDVQMPGQDVTVTLAALNQLTPRPEVIVLSMFDDRHLERELSTFGIRAFLHKSVTLETLVGAIVLIASSSSEFTVSVSTSGQRADGPKSVEERPSLSAREIEVLRGVADALSNRQIGKAMGITEGTVKRHLRNVFTKLGAISRLDAVNKATDLSILGPTRRSRSQEIGVAPTPIRPQPASNGDCARPRAASTAAPNRGRAHRHAKHELSMS